MLRIDGAYLYELGTQLRPIAAMAEKESSKFEVYFILYNAKNALEPFLNDSIFSGSLRTVRNPANELLVKIYPYLPDLNKDIDWEIKIPGWVITSIKTVFRKFEAVLLAELQTTALYYVSPKGGFDTVCLTDNGESLFPADIAMKVPNSIHDIKAGARCLAFDLHTAAGFHFHRANEAVLRSYFDVVAGSDNRPKTRNMGDYIKKMESLGVGDAKVIDVLKSLKDLHRNPLMHPDDLIQSIDEALSLYAAIRAAIGYMLDRIPNAPVLSVTPIAPLPVSLPPGN